MKKNTKKAPPVVSKVIMNQLDTYIAQQLKNVHDNPKGLLMGVLHHVQVVCGYLPESVIEHVAERLKVPVAHIYGMSTFYNYFTLKPKARNTIFMCKGTACYVSGGQRVLKKLSSELGIEVGETTHDGTFSLNITRCLGCCGLSPVMQINEDVHVRMTPEKVPGILNKYRKLS